MASVYSSDPEQFKQEVFTDPGSGRYPARSQWSFLHLHVYVFVLCASYQHRLKRTAWNLGTPFLTDVPHPKLPPHQALFRKAQGGTHTGLVLQEPGPPPPWRPAPPCRHQVPVCGGLPWGLSSARSPSSLPRTAGSFCLQQRQGLDSARLRPPAQPEGSTCAAFG